MKIIDISSAQGFIHWPVVAETIDSVILKAADGHFEDNEYFINRLKLDKYKIPLMSVYGWFYPPRPDQTLQSMAKAFYTYAMGAKMELDLELMKGQVWQLSYKQNVVDHLDALDQLAGTPTIAYLGAEMLSHFINEDGTYPDWISKRPIHWAVYPLKINSNDQWNLNNYSFHAPPNIPPAFTGKIWLWQFSGNGVVNGIPGNQVDLNTDTFTLLPIPTYSYNYKVISPANVRAAPSSSSTLLGVVTAGTSLVVQNNVLNNGYLYYTGCSQPSAPKAGWVYGSYLQGGAI